MKQSLWLLVAIVLLFATTPALAQKGEPPPTPAGPPPKSAPPPTPTQPQPTEAANTSTDLPTPVPAKPTSPPTPTLLPTVPGKPTVPPTPTSSQTVTRDSPILPTPASGPAAQPSPMGTSMAPLTPTHAPIVLTASPSPVSLAAAQTALPTDAAVSGHVQEADVGGVPTALNGQVKAVIDAIMGGSVLVVIGLLAFNLFASFTQSAAVRALERTYRRQKSQEFELAMARELQERQEHLGKLLQENPDSWRAVTSQLLADAGLGVSPSYIEEVAAAPCPHVAIAGSDGLLYVFTSDPDWVKQRSRVIALDSSLSHFARIEAHTLWQSAAEHLSERITLPRDIAWYLVVARPRRALSLTQRGKVKRIVTRFWRQIWALS